MLIGFTEVETRTVIVRLDAFIDSKIGEGGYILWVVEHGISKFPNVVENCPKTSDEGGLEPAPGLRDVTYVVGDVCLCHKMAPAIGNSPLKEITPSDGGLIVVGLL